MVSHSGEFLPQGRWALAFIFLHWCFPRHDRRVWTMFVNLRKFGCSYSIRKWNSDNVRYIVQYEKNENDYSFLNICMTPFKMDSKYMHMYSLAYYS